MTLPTVLIISHVGFWVFTSEHSKMTAGDVWVVSTVLLA